MPDNQPLDTKKLMRLLREKGDFDHFLKNGGQAVSNPTLTARLLSLLDESGLSIAQVADCAMLSQPFTYQVFSGVRKPGRNALLSIALAMRLDLEETQRLLTLAQKGELYPRVQRDAVVIYAIEHGLTLEQTEELLRQTGEASLFTKAFQASV
jgi:transcriptional regulator with XRE-family HTH domain